MSEFNNNSETESLELKLTNARLSPFKVGDKVKVIRLGLESMDLEDGWIIDGYSEKFEEAILHKTNTEGLMQPGQEHKTKPPAYLYERASVKLLKDWNPEYEEWE